MGQPIWKSANGSTELIVTVPDADGILWTPALEYVRPGALLKFEVVPTLKVKQADGTEREEEHRTWQPVGLKCGADGDPTAVNTQGLPIARAARGALIGRIGGSTADLVPDDSSLLFVVGRLCVLQVPESKRGALFLAVNDKPESAAKLGGKLIVRVSEAL